MNDRAAPPPSPAAPRAPHVAPPIEDRTRPDSPTRPDIAAEKRLGVVQGDRLCVRCGFTLYGQPTVREPHYNLVIVRCPECSTVAALQEYPMLGRWANRWAALLVGLYLLVLIAALFGGGGILTGLAYASANQCSDRFAEFIAARHHDWVAGMDDEALAALKGNVGQFITQQTGAWSWVADEWWQKQDARALFQAAGGVRGAIRWSGLWTWWIVLIVGMVIGTIWSLALLGMRCTRVLPVALVSVVLAGIFCYISMTDEQQYGISAQIASNLAQRAIGPPVAAATLVLAALSVAAGVWLGRPIARGVARAMLPPRSRGALALLWTSEGRTPPLTVLRR